MMQLKEKISGVAMALKLAAFSQRCQTSVRLSLRQERRSFGHELERSDFFLGGCTHRKKMS
jgi:hypothetical protein